MVNYKLSKGQGSQTTFGKLLRQVKELESDNKRLGGNIPNFDIEKEIDDAAAQDQLLLESKVDKKIERTTSTIEQIWKEKPCPYNEIL